VRDTEPQFIRFLKLRFGLLGATAAVIGLGMLGLIDLFSTTSIDAVPVYVHVTVGAIVFPLGVFAFEYRGVELADAVRLGAGAGVTAIFFLLLLSEGAGRMTNGVLELGLPTLFYVVSVSLISSTVIVTWFNRVYLQVSVPRRRTPRRE
jgi:hypothetical protein